MANFWQDDVHPYKVRLSLFDDGEPPHWCYGQHAHLECSRSQVCTKTEKSVVMYLCVRGHVFVC